MPKWFISKETVKHDLGDGEWIECKKDISYEDFTRFFEGIDFTTSKGQFEMVKPMLKSVVVNWGLKGEDGEEVPFSLEKIDELSLSAIMLLAQPIFESFFAEKKSSMPSSQSTEKESPEEE